MDKLLIFSRISIVLCVLALAGYIANQHIPFTGIKTIQYTFDRPHGAVGIFRPPVRYELIESGSKRIAKVIEDPVYFDVKTSVPYASATILFNYQKHTQKKTQLAVRGWQDGVKFSTVPFEETIVGDWVQARAVVDLTKAMRENDKYTFAVSIPGLIAHISDEYILVSDMTIQLVRQPLLQSL